MLKITECGLDYEINYSNDNVRNVMLRHIEQLQRALRKARDCDTGAGFRICDDCRMGINRLLGEDGRRVTPEEMLSAIDSAVLVEREACANVCEEESGVAAEMGHERFARYSAEMAGKIRMRTT